MKKRNQNVFYVAVDTEAYKVKPKGNEIGAINNRIVKHQREITLEQLVKKIKEGKSYLPCQLKQGKIRRKEYWKRQNIFVLDIDEGMTLEEAREHDFIRSHASFLHTTFSHTENKNKFRIIFVTDRDVTTIEEFDIVMEWLFSKIPQADKACKDRARLFFGGYEVFWIDKKNSLNVDEIVSHTLLGDKKNDLYTPPNPFQAPNPSQSSNVPNNVEAIRNQDVQLLQQTFKRDAEIVIKNQIEDYLKRLPLYEYLGIVLYKSFIDIFHDESNPSASIFQSNKKNGHWLYKCFSSSHSFSGTIIDVTMKLQGCQKYEAIKFLMNVFNIKYENQPSIEQFEHCYEYYLEYMAGNDLKEQYPDLYKVLNKSKALGLLVNLLSFVKNDINATGTQIECYYSIGTLSQELDVSKAQLGKKINLFGYLGFLSKKSDETIDKKFLEELNQNRINNNRTYRSNVYVFGILGVELLKEANEKAKVYLESGLTLNTLSYEGTSRSFGQEQANEMFPQDKHREIKIEHDDNVMELVKVIGESIDGKGWIAQKEVIENVRFGRDMSKAKKADIFKIAIKQILDDYGLEIVQLTKDIKIEMNIDESVLSKSSFPKIIRKRLK